MKNLLYIGNKLSGTSKTVTTIDTLSTWFTETGFKVTTASGKTNKWLRLWDMLWHIFKYRKQTDFVLIDTYSTQNFYYAYLSSRLCRIFKLKYIPILHGGNLPNRLKKSPKLSKALFNHAYINVAPSAYTKFNFESLGYHNIICIPNAIALENYAFKPRTLEKIRLLWVRSFSEIYNPLLAVDLLKALKDQNFDAELCMVGPEVDGSLQKTKAHAKTLGVNVRFMGKLSKPEWLALSKDYTVFINTTNIDNMPVSVIEAMALGLPIISTNIGGLPFLINNHVNGLLVKPNSAEAFVNGIKILVSDLKKTQKIIAQARQDVMAYDWSHVKIKWIKIFNE